MSYLFIGLWKILSDYFINNYFMKFIMIKIWLRKGILIGMLFAFIIPISAFGQQTETGLELDGSISDAAYSVAQKHFEDAQKELAKKNLTGAQYHWNLGGMSQDEISAMIQAGQGGERLTPEDKETLENNAANCIILSIGSVKCME
jgi:hypothetical protein